ncbi:MAG TPA: DUF1080 domain-containing protein [Gemmatimonadaceae bacterium]|jgi:hypothetical protein
MGSLKQVALIAGLALVASACAHHNTMSGSGAAASASVAGAGAGAWKSLNDPSSWRGYKTDTIPSRWMFANGVLSKTRPVADIVSKEEYGNFELEIEWKIGEAGNSGIFYRGTEEYDHIYWTAPEYQLLDNIKADDNKTPLTRAAAVYGLYPAPEGHVKAVGEWNQARIVARGNHVEHWLNGFLMEQYELLSPDWEAKVQASKFKAWPHYGRATRGHIALQGDHNGELSFRNMRIRELP